MNIYSKFKQEILNTVYSGQIYDDLSTLVTASTDNSVYELRPDLICYPKNKLDISILLQVLNQEQFASISITARGGATGTNGQSLNYGLVIDTSKFMQAIIELDLKQETIVVEPGISLQKLNLFLEPHGYFFPPDVSSGTRATLGGMVATDASGKGSRVYGKTSDYLIHADTILADATEFRFASAIKSNCKRDKKIISALYVLAQQAEPHIEKHFPSINRGLTGYNLKKLFSDCNTLDYNNNSSNKGNGNKQLNLQYLIAGSEGTLGIITELKLKIKKIEPYRSMIVLHFENFLKAIAAITAILPYQPLAVESMDDNLLELVKGDTSFKKVESYLSFNKDIRTSCLCVELRSSTKDKLEQQIKALLSFPDKYPDCIKAIESKDFIADIWHLRSKAVGILGRMAGKSKPQAFIEDVVVEPKNLYAYISDLQQLLQKYNLKYGMYGHIDVGCIHVRPALNMLQAKQRKLIRIISDEVVELSLKYNGIFWGEHGKGIRGEYNKKIFGLELTKVMQEIKLIFDKKLRLNPGKLVDFSNYKFNLETKPTSNSFKGVIYKIDKTQMRGKLDMSINLQLRKEYQPVMHCNGNSQCTSYNVYTVMCPSFKASGNKNLSPKGRAMILKEWLRLRSDKKVNLDNIKHLESALFQNLEQCLSCATCATSCPVLINIPQIKAKFYWHYFKSRIRPLSHFVFMHFEKILPIYITLFKLLPRCLAIKKIKILQFFLQKIIVDLPIPYLNDRMPDVRKISYLLHDDNFICTSLLPNFCSLKKRKIVLIQDAFTGLLNQDVLVASYDVLTKLGLQVEIYKYKEYGKAKQVLGDFKKFNKVAKKRTSEILQIVARGYEVVVLETAIAKLLQQDYKEATGKNLKVKCLAEFLADFNVDNLQNNNKTQIKQVNLFLHCMEQNQTFNFGKVWQNLLTSSGYQVKIAAVGCCGMSGIFGHQSGNKNLSKKIYNTSWRDAIKVAINNKHDAAIAMTGYSCLRQTIRFNRSLNCKNTYNVKKYIYHPIQLLALKLNNDN